jgi:hypothetical protein
VPCLFLSLLLLQQIHPRLSTRGAPWLPASPVPPPGTEDARAGVRWRDDVGGGMEPGPAAGHEETRPGGGGDREELTPGKC